MKFVSKQEKTQYYTTNNMNLFSTYDVQYSNEANLRRILCATWYFTFCVTDSSE